MLAVKSTYLGMEQREKKMLSLAYFFLCSSAVQFSRSSTDFITPAGTAAFRRLLFCCMFADEPTWWQSRK